MSLPPEILNQLLSGHLDGALTADERARVEQLLADDPAVREQYMEMKELSESLKLLDRSNSSRLDDGFVDRVLAGAVNEAASEGLSDDHPVMMLAQQPSVPLNLAPTGMPVIWKVAGGLVAIAATVFVAVAVLTPPENNNIANSEPVDTNSGIHVAENDSERGSVDQSNDPIIKPEADLIDSPRPDSKQPEMIAASDVPDGGQDSKEPDTVEAEKPKVKATETKIAVVPNDLPNKALAGLAKGIVLIYDVRLTQRGIDEDAIGVAMKESKIVVREALQINSDMVSFKHSVKKGDDTAKVLYLEASAKQLDNFANRLYLNEEGVQSIGFNLSMQAPLFNLADSLHRIDPTKVKHASAWNLEDKSGASVSVLAQELIKRKFSVMKRGKNLASTMLSGTQGSIGGDVPSRIFLIVR